MENGSRRGCLKRNPPLHSSSNWFPLRFVNCFKCLNHTRITTQGVKSLFSKVSKSQTPWTCISQLLELDYWRLDFHFTLVEAGHGPKPKHAHLIIMIFLIIPFCHFWDESFESVPTLFSSACVWRLSKWALAKQDEGVVLVLGCIREEAVEGS